MNAPIVSLVEAITNDRIRAAEAEAARLARDATREEPRRRRRQHRLRALAGRIAFAAFR
jgi:hypothetical protein